tara:strand:+ start:35912 stop:37540 length:1629 start_codon:yes stop_codon:yes gene_type:complete
MNKILKYLDLSLPAFFYDNLISFGVLFILFLVALIGLRKILKLVFNKILKFEKLNKYHQKIKALKTFLMFLTKIVLWTGSLTIIGFSCYAIVKDINIYNFLLSQIAKIPANFWYNLLISFGKIIALVIFSKYFIRYANLLLKKGKQKLLEYKNVCKNDESIKLVFNHLNRIVKFGVILTIANISLFLLISNSEILTVSRLILKLFFIINIGLLIVSVFKATVEIIDAISEKYATKKGVGDYYKELHYLVPVFKRTVEYIIYTLTASVTIVQFEALTTLSQYVFSTVQSIGLWFVARLLIAICNLFIDRNYLNEKIEGEILQRNKTIYPIFKTLISVVIYFIIILIILNLFGFNPLPLLAGAGILSMVLGLGAQNIINDILTGFIIIMENNYKVGDIVEINDMPCEIEEISLRTTKVRAEDGKVIILRNGDIKQVVNHSSKFTNAMVNIGIDKDSNLTHVYDVLESLSKELFNQNDDMLEPMENRGVVDFLGPEIIIRTITKCKAGKNLAVKRIIRKAILLRFRQENIKIPFDVRVKVLNKGD